MDTLKFIFLIKEVAFIFSFLFGLGLFMALICKLYAMNDVYSDVLTPPASKAVNMLALAFLLSVLTTVFLPGQKPIHILDSNKTEQNFAQRRPCENLRRTN